MKKTMKKTPSAVLRPALLVSLGALAAACGTYSAATGNASAGGTGNGSGGSTSNAESGGSTSNAESGGSTSNAESGGSTSNAESGGSTSNAESGGSTSSNGGSGAATGGATSAGGAIARGGSSAGGSATGGVAASTGGAIAKGGSSAGGSATGGVAASTGGAIAKGGASSVGGAATGGAATGGAATGGAATGGAPSIALPCDVLKAGGQTCVSAHSTVRVIVSGYTGPLYQVCKGSYVAGPASCKGTTQDIGSTAGYANAAAQDTFCSGSTCTITKIYDQSGQGNHLEPAPKGGAKPTPDNPANATALKTTVNGHAAYGVLITPGMGYRTGCSGCTIKTGNGTATGDAPETQYMVTSQLDLVNGCCFDYGNAETTSNDDGNGTMEAVYMGLGVIWGTGVQGGPWVMADLENGLYAGWENNQDKNISTNTPLKYNFINAVVVGDTRDKNSAKGRFALYGGDATAGVLKTMYDGIRPAKAGYVPMLKQGSIILGIGGDNSGSGGGRFYEGVMANGAATKATVDALQAAIVAAGYGK